MIDIFVDHDFIGRFSWQQQWDDDDDEGGGGGKRERGRRRKTRKKIKRKRRRNKKTKPQHLPINFIDNQNLLVITGEYLLMNFMVKLTWWWST